MTAAQPSVKPMGTRQPEMPKALAERIRRRRIDSGEWQKATTRIYCSISVIDAIPKLPGTVPHL